MKLPKSHLLSVNGVRLNTIISGPPSGHACIFLHGFPDASFGWRNQIDTLSNAGARVVAPDLRGANLSSKPTLFSNYRISDMVQDVICLADMLKLDSFTLIGHDFGGALAWHLAARYPHRVEQLVVLNAPHPTAFTRALEDNPTQQMYSAYIGAIALPWIAQLYIEALSYTPLRQNMPAMRQEVMDTYEHAWQQPSALFGMTSWYRANLLHPPPKVGWIEPPTTILWGAQDPFLITELANASAAFCHSSAVHLYPEAGHWLQVKRSDEVNEMLINSLHNASG